MTSHFNCSQTHCASLSHTHVNAHILPTSYTSSHTHTQSCLCTCPPLHIHLTHTPLHLNLIPHTHTPSHIPQTYSSHTHPSHIHFTHIPHTHTHPNSHIRDTAGQERFRTLTNAYFRGAAVSVFTNHICLASLSNIIVKGKHDC